METVKQNDLNSNFSCHNADIYFSISHYLWLLVSSSCRTSQSCLIVITLRLSGDGEGFRSKFPSLSSSWSTEICTLCFGPTGRSWYWEELSLRGSNEPGLSDPCCVLRDLAENTGAPSLAVPLAEYFPRPSRGRSMGTVARTMASDGSTALKIRASTQV